MAYEQCSIEGCELDPVARGYCSGHYGRVKRLGNPRADQPLMHRGLTADDRFDAKVKFTMYCWEWTGSRNPQGHGQQRRRGRLTQAHRIAYERWVGPIPEGVIIDHRCGERACVNPLHLRLSSDKRNNENRTVLNRNNSSGFRGVIRHHAGRWMVEVTHNRRKHRRYGFESPESANEAAIELRNQLFTDNELDRRGL